MTQSTPAPHTDSAPPVATRTLISVRDVSRVYQRKGETV